MKIIISPDSFKGSISSADACEVIKRSILELEADADIVCVPIADGGEETLDALVPVERQKRTEVTGPLFEKVSAVYGYTDNMAIIEMAVAAGLTLIPESRRKAADTTTYGVGELILDAIGNGYKKIMLTVGGSATNDGGCGMLAALGAKFFDGDGNSFVPTGGTLKDIARIDISGVRRELYDCEFFIATDVKNPLVGELGATNIYAPQKGATAEELSSMENGMSHYAALLKELSGKDVATVEGAGAGGGVSVPLIALFRHRIRSGIDTVLDSAEFDLLLSGADAVITGEGRIDTQSLFGKAISGVTRRANAAGVPVYCFVGGIGSDKSELLKMGIEDIYDIASLARSLDDAMSNASGYLFDIAKRFLEEVRKNEK